MDILHVVVLMLENRSFDCVFGKLQTKLTGIDGLSGNESNIWQKAPGGPSKIGVWNDPTLTSVTATIPDPDPGEFSGPGHSPAGSRHGRQNADGWLRRQLYGAAGGGTNRGTPRR